jgi:hypothetical protein
LTSTSTPLIPFLAPALDTEPDRALYCRAANLVATSLRLVRSVGQSGEQLALPTSD